MELNVTILGNRLTLVANDESRPAEVNRLGSIKLVFPDGDAKIIRVFGLLNDQVEEYARRVEFEKLLRAECEKPEILKALFAYTGPKPYSKRFNASQGLAEKGWRNRNADRQRAYQPAH